MGAQLTLFPLQYQRQEAVPIDKDSVFSSTQLRLDYLNSPRRYAGQPVTDLEENKFYILSSDRTQWLPIVKPSVTPYISLKEYTLNDYVTYEEGGIEYLFRSEIINNLSVPEIGGDDWKLIGLSKNDILQTYCSQIYSSNSKATNTTIIIPEIVGCTLDYFIAHRGTGTILLGTDDEPSDETVQVDNITGVVSYKYEFSDDFEEKLWFEYKK